MNALPVALLVLLLALGVPLPGSAEDTCEHVSISQYVVLNVRIHHGAHKCRYYDVVQEAHVLDTLERYEGFTPDPASPTGLRSAFTYVDHTLELRFSDGRTTVHRETRLLSGATYAEHDYYENRDPQGRQTCRGAADFLPGVIPGRVSVPTTPNYPRCPPPGLLA